MNNLPTVFHVTHLKAGSQWVAEVLKHSAPERVVIPQSRLGHVLYNPIKPGGVYPTVYLSKPDCDAILATISHPHRVLVVLRDLRDTLISLYFSLKISHSVSTPDQRRLRERLCNVDDEQGLLLLIDQEEERSIIRKLLSLPIMDRRAWVGRHDAFTIPISWAMALIAEIQRTWWLNAGLCIRYEDLVRDEYTVFGQIIDYCEIEVPRQRLHEIIRYNTFEAVTGRRPGQEDPTAHQRKGIVGDWRNHFTDRVKETFKERFGEVLIQTGYEEDLDW